MSTIVNLRQVRKEKARHAKELVAEANRAKHGTPKSAHKKAKVIAEKDLKRLDGHRLDD
jgi:hypothetical protein